MKKIAIITVSCLVLFSACFFHSQGGEGTITISFGGSARSADWPPSEELIAQLEHRITLKGPDGSEKKATFANGTSSARFTVEVGIWKIIVDGFLEGEHYSTGSGSVEAKAGQNNLVTIKMEPKEPPEGDYDLIFTVSNPAQWEEAVTVIKDGGNDRSYLINIVGTVEIPGASYRDYTFGDPTSTYIRVTISAAPGTSGTLKLNSNGALLYIGENQAVTIENVSLEGRNNNTDSLVSISSGVLRMNSGEIYGNTTNSSGGGVSVGGLFFMSGGKIHSNKSTRGGGVNIHGGTFTMSGGEINGNTAVENGGGVNFSSYMSNFHMSGGTIYDNEATSNGGGVYVWGTFRMNGGIIAGSNAVEPLTPNTASNGAALYVYPSNNSFATYGYRPNYINLPRGDNTIHVVNGVLQP